MSFQYRLKFVKYDKQGSEILSLINRRQKNTLYETLLYEK